MSIRSRWVTAVAFACAAFAATLASNAFAATINVLWYSYAHPQSEYKAFFTQLAATGIPHPTGDTWNLTFFGPNDPAPDFAAFDVLVIHSGEAFRTGPPGGENVTPDYSGIFGTKAAIEAARGNRTLLTGSDADFHAVRGDSGTCGTGSWCLDGALGVLINAVNWAAGGTGLGIVSFIDGSFAGSFWWDNPGSFLKDELSGYVTHVIENAGVIDAGQATYPLNQGLTSAGISNWNFSFHAAFLATIPGYTAIVNSAEHPEYVLTIAKGISVVHPVAVVLQGSGSGSVESNPAGITCGSDCNEWHAITTEVVLTQTAEPGSIFTGWLGACTGLDPTCTVTVNGPVNVSATFAPDSIAPLRADIDGNGQYRALTDGLLAIRYLFGLTGDPLVVNAIGAGATNSTAEEVEAYLADTRPIFDIDGNGRVTPITDGLIFIRYLFGLRGERLIVNSIGTGARRTTPEQIEAYIQSFMAVVP